uniref:P2X purinoceptor n=1 Tax=Terrapene triunguis TaxID=2587831 RepID=A0A674JD83_9SAUR
LALLFQSEVKYSCVSDSDCQRPVPTTGGGILTGRCVNYNRSLRTCEIQGWCPAEVDTVQAPIMLEAENFTLFIKNSIRFPLFDFEKGNLLPNLTAQDIQTCRFHPVTQPFCPILRLGDIVRFADQDFSKLASTGGILGIKIGWLCDLDRSWEHCVPSYTFTRLDSVSEKNNVSPGYNFRYAKYYRRENGTEYRTLMKAFGIRFDVLVYGNAGKFNIIPTLINTVAAFTSVGVGTVLCDIILLNFLKGAEQYKAKKFEEVSPREAEPKVLQSLAHPTESGVLDLGRAPGYSSPGVSQQEALQGAGQERWLWGELPAAPVPASPSRGRCGERSWERWLWGKLLTPTSMTVAIAWQSPPWVLPVGRSLHALVVGVDPALCPLQVTEVTLRHSPVYRSSQMLGGRNDEKQSTDSGAYSIGL